MLKKLYEKFFSSNTEVQNSSQLELNEDMKALAYLLDDYIDQWDLLKEFKFRHNVFGPCKFKGLIFNNILYFIMEFDDLPEGKRIGKFPKYTFYKGSFAFHECHKNDGKVDKLLDDLYEELNFIRKFSLPKDIYFLKRKIFTNPYKEGSASKKCPKYLDEDKFWFLEDKYIDLAIDLQEDNNYFQFELNDELKFPELIWKYLEDPRYNHQFLNYYDIYTKMEARERLNGREIELLKRNQSFDVLAKYYLDMYQVDDAEKWYLILAMKYLRKAGFSKIALLISQHELIYDPELASAYYTTRGGAFRDLNNFIEAENNAFYALETGYRTFHPFSLLGAIYIQCGLPRESDYMFYRAKRLGAEFYEFDEEIKKLLSNTNKENRKLVVLYLLEKDKTRYEWAEKYV
jgi:hypothetical protein